MNGEVPVNHRSKPKRPRSVTILALGVLIITVFFWARVYQAIVLRSLIETLAPNVSLAYIVLTGLIFGVAGLPISWGLWTGKPWAASAGQQFFFALAAYYWLDRIFIVVSDAVRGNWPFALGTTIITLVWVTWIFSSRPTLEFFKTSRDNFPANGDRNVE